MKKFIINIILVIAFIIIYLLQVNIFSYFKIAGVMPNLLIIFILFIGLFASKGLGVTYGIIVGIFMDLSIGKRIGISGIMMGIVGLLGGILDKNFSKESKITIIIMVILTTIIYEVGAYIFGYFMYSYDIKFFAFIKILLIESLYNIILTIILYPMIKSFGYKIEEEYKGNKILTRYF